MKCKNCGGELVFKDGMGICAGCGTSYKIDHVFEEVEVYLCYTENDVHGRRTKDSIIAVDIYQKLQAKKVDVFCERISAANAAGEDLAVLRYQAMNKAKIVMIIGSQETHFENLLEKYAEDFEGKNIIPVYSDMRPENLPEALRKRQALNYDAIGADADMVKGILAMLGRDSEMEITEVQDKARKKRKTALVVLLCTLVVVLGAALTFFWFHYQAMKEPPELTPQETYDAAQALMDEGKHLEAADMFKTIGDFKNSRNFLKSIYDRYDGYYQTEQLDILFYINIQNGDTVDVMLERRLKDNKIVRFEDSTTLAENKITIAFTDTQSNTGNVVITLRNDRLHIKTTITKTANALSVGELDLTFTLDQRTDKPERQEITQETILSWMSNRITLNDLKQAGYELEFGKTMTAGGGTNNHAKSYKIVNSDVQILTMDFDLSKTKEYNEMEQNLLSDYAVYAVIAPAELIAPDLVGKETPLLTKNDVMYLPHVTGFELWGPLESTSPEYSVWFTRRADINPTVQRDTLVGVASKKLMGDYNYTDMVAQFKDQVLTDAAKMHFAAEHNLEDVEYDTFDYIVARKDENILIGITSWEEGLESFVSFYVGNMNTLEITFVKQIDAGFSINSLGAVEVIMQAYPEDFQDFLE